MAFKTVNNTLDLDGLIHILLIFGVYPRIQNMDLPTLTIIQRAAATEKVMDEVRKIRAENELADVLNTRYRLLMDFDHDWLLNSDVLVWREDNAR